MNGKLLAAVAVVVVVIAAAAGAYYLLNNDGDGGDSGDMLLPGSKVVYDISENGSGLYGEQTYTVVGWKDDTYYLNLEWGSNPDIDAMLSYPEAMAELPEGSTVEDTTVDVPGIGQREAVRLTATESGLSMSLVYISDMGYLLYSVEEGFDGAMQETISIASTDPILGSYEDISPETATYTAADGSTATLERISHSVDDGYLYHIDASPRYAYYVGDASGIPTDLPEGSTECTIYGSTIMELRIAGGAIASITVDGVTYTAFSSAGEIRTQIVPGDELTYRISGMDGEFVVEPFLFSLKVVSVGGYFSKVIEEGGPYLESETRYLPNDTVQSYVDPITLVATMLDGTASDLLSILEKTGTEVRDTFLGTIECDVLQADVGDISVIAWVGPNGEPIASQVSFTDEQYLFEAIYSTLYNPAPEYNPPKVQMGDPSVLSPGDYVVVGILLENGYRVETRTVTAVNGERIEFTVDYNYGATETHRGYYTDLFADVQSDLLTSLIPTEFDDIVTSMGEIRCSIFRILEAGEIVVMWADADTGVVFRTQSLEPDGSVTGVELLESSIFQIIS